MPIDEDERPGVARQAGTVPADIRRAVLALNSDAAFALLTTIKQSGETRFSWLRQELYIDNQEIVETLGRLYEAELITTTETGSNEARETAYIVTELGATMLETLADIPAQMARRRQHIPPSDTTTDSNPNSSESDTEHETPTTEFSIRDSL